MEGFIMGWNHQILQEYIWNSPHCRTWCNNSLWCWWVSPTSAFDSWVFAWISTRTTKQRSPSFECLLDSTRPTKELDPNLSFLCSNLYSVSRKVPSPSLRLSQAFVTLLWTISELISINAHFKLQMIDITQCFWSVFTSIACHLDLLLLLVFICFRILFYNFVLRLLYLAIVPIYSEHNLFMSECWVYPLFDNPL